MHINTLACVCSTGRGRSVAGMGKMVDVCSNGVEVSEHDENACVCVGALNKILNFII